MHTVICKLFCSRKSRSDTPAFFRYWGKCTHILNIWADDQAQCIAHAHKYINILADTEINVIAFEFKLD